MKQLALAAAAWMVLPGSIDAQDMPKPQKEHDWLRQIVGEFDTEGPGQDGKPAKFRESIEVRDQDHKVYTSSVEKDGKRVTFQKIQYSRGKGALAARPSGAAAVPVQARHRTHSNL